MGHGSSRYVTWVMSQVNVSHGSWVTGQVIVSHASYVSSVSSLCDTAITASRVSLLQVLKEQEAVECRSVRACQSSY